MRIIKRKNTHSLMHSFRKEGKVITREKYLGKTIPTNIEKLKQQFLHECLQEGVFIILNKIKQSFQKEWKSLPKSIKEKTITEWAIEFTYNTNAIEGSTITLEETEELVNRKIAPHKPLSDVEETKKHAETFRQTLTKLPPLSLSLIKGWHQQLFGETKKDIAGTFRDYLVRVGDYVAPDWQDVEKLMGEFISWYKKNSNAMHPVELAARAHYTFEKIHPFGDGNGRIGRLIIALILHKHGYPQLIIEYKRRKSYYHALSKSENDFLAYFIRRYVNANRRYVK